MISKLDTDGDGLPDEWEHSGDIDGDGKADISDADPEKTDIYIQIDWMPGFRPTNTAMQTVVNAFKNSGAGYENKGINLHLVYGQQIPNRKVIDLSSDYSEWIDLANTYFADETARRVYRWALFANMYDLGDGTGSSGLASNIPGQMFMVTLGGWTFDTDADRDRVVASTFMHELGHTLGLKHGGCDHINGKPNYISIMSYTYQLYGLNPGGIVDYSHEELPPIDPEHVNENDGIDPDGISKTGCAWYFGGYRYSLTSAKGAIDFNQDGKLEDSVEIDFKDSHGRSLPKKTYYGNNDWASIVCYGGTVGYQGDTMPAPEVNPPEEITEEQDFEEFLEQKEQIEPSSGKAKISINNYTASTTVPFRATMVLTAIFENAPKGSEVHWYVDGKHIGEGDTLTATNIREKFTAQAKLRDKDGNILASSEMETVNVRSGIIARIVAFFRSIFGMLPTIYQ